MTDFIGNIQRKTNNSMSKSSILWYYSSGVGSEMVVVFRLYIVICIYLQMFYVCSVSSSKDEASPKPDIYMY